MTGRLAHRAVLLAAAPALALAWAPAAHGHATLLVSEPRSGAVQSESPERVLLMFDEPVETPPGAVRVYDGTGKRVDRGGLLRPDAPHVGTALELPLARGTYTVAWRVVSGDSDPVSGAFVFHVKRPGPHPGGIAAEVLVDTPTGVTVAYDVARFLEYALLLLCAGGMLALVLVLVGASPTIRRRLFLAIGVASLVLVAVSLVELVLQGAAAGGVSPREALRWSVVESVAGTRFGEASLARAALAFVLSFVAFASAGGREGRFWPGSALVLSLVLLATPVAVSHASASGRLATAADALHIAAAAAWTGGLAFVVAALVQARGERWALATHAVPRFSRLAVVSVGVLIAAGIVNGYLQVRTWSALWETTYGRLLLAKIALLTPLLALGAFNNRYAVPRLRSVIASVAEQRRFLRAVGGELALMIGIVAITAVLVSAPPARTQHATTRPHRGDVQFGPFVATVRVLPARAGRNMVRVDFQHAQVPVALRIAASLERERIGPLRSTLRHTAHPTFVGRDVPFPIPGVWSVRLEARLDRFGLFTTTVPVRIEPAR